MHRKGLVIGIFILLIGVNIGSTFAGDADVKTMSSVGFDGNTLYVGGTGEGNYTKIQDAIDNSSHGDTVFVYNGFYDDYFPENSACVFINENINLFGEDKYNTIIDGGNDRNVIRIYSDDVNISGFTIQNSGGNGFSDSGVDIPNDNCTIYDNIIKNNNNGISIPEGTGCEIYNNIITDNVVGIKAHSYFTTIIGNIIENNEVGINIEGMVILIQNNHIAGGELGIEIYEGRARIIENNFIDNDVQAFSSNLIMMSPFIGRNLWLRNYWDNWRIPIPKPIIHFFYFIILPLFIPVPVPLPKFDWFPAIFPYDISIE